MRLSYAANGLTVHLLKSPRKTKAKSSTSYRVKKMNYIYLRIISKTTTPYTFAWRKEAWKILV